MDYILPILGFLTGGGFTAIVSLRYIKQTSKIDYTEKLSNFWEEQNDKLLKRFSELEKRVLDLEKISCERTDCPARIKSIA